MGGWVRGVAVDDPGGAVGGLGAVGLVRVEIQVGSVGPTAGGLS